MKSMTYVVIANGGAEVVVVHQDVDRAFNHVLRHITDGSDILHRRTMQRHHAHFLKKVFHVTHDFPLQNSQGFHDADSIFDVAVDLVRAILHADLVAVVADMEKNHVVVMLVAHGADKVVVLHISIFCPKT